MASMNSPDTKEILGNIGAFILGLLYNGKCYIKNNDFLTISVSHGNSVLSSSYSKCSCKFAFTRTGCSFNV